LSCLPAVDSQECAASNLEQEKIPAYDPRWYALFVMSRHEKRLVGHCAERSIESFLPVYQVKHRWKNRCTAMVDLPLFPNYLFVRFERQQRVQILSLPGVFSIVSSGREMLPIADEYMTSLRGGLLAHRIAPHPNVEVGDRVCITTGPMAGMEGILDRQKNELRVVLRLDMIGRSVAVEVGTEEIAYVGTRQVYSSRLEGHALYQPLTSGT
jgi:transcription antitermination factor NusG